MGLFDRFEGLRTAHGQIKAQLTGHEPCGPVRPAAYGWQKACTEVSPRSAHGM